MKYRTFVCGSVNYFIFKKIKCGYEKRGQNRKILLKTKHSTMTKVISIVVYIYVHTRAINHFVMHSRNFEMMSYVNQSSVVHNSHIHCFLDEIKIFERIDRVDETEIWIFYSILEIWRSGGITSIFNTVFICCVMGLFMKISRNMFHTKRKSSNHSGI